MDAIYYFPPGGYLQQPSGEEPQKIQRETTVLAADESSSNVEAELESTSGSKILSLDRHDTDSPAFDDQREEAQYRVPSSTSSSASSAGPPSLYDEGNLTPSICYERDSSKQKLIAIVGREFDGPAEIASDLQSLLSQKYVNFAPAKFVPYTIKRKALRKGTFETRDLNDQDLICFCYNASEARILLTGSDGYYTAFLKLVEALLGPNKVAFIVSNYCPPGEAQADNSNELVAQVLKTRLYNQESLKMYLDKEQVLSWKSKPNDQHLNRLLDLANLQCNPNRACVLL